MSLATEIESIATAKNEKLSNTETQPVDSGISTAAISKKLPLKITQDDNRLIINLVPTPTIQRANRSKSDQNHKTNSATPSSTTVATAKATANTTVLNNNNNNRKSNRTRDRSQNENLIRIIKENIEPINQLQPCDLFLLPLLQLSDYSSDYLKQQIKTSANNEFIMANLLKKTTTTTTTTNRRKSTLIQQTTTTHLTTAQQQHQQQQVTFSDLDRSNSFLAEFANKFKIVKAKQQENKKQQTGGSRNLKELIGEAGDLSHLFMPIVQLAELDVERKKCNRIISAFKQVTESYRRNRKLNKDPEPLPKQFDLARTSSTTVSQPQSHSIDKSKSLINLNQVLNSAAATATSTAGLNAPVTAPTKKKLINHNLQFNRLNVTTKAITVNQAAPDPPPRLHSIPGYSTNKENNQDLIPPYDTRLTFSTEATTTNTSMDLNNCDQKYFNQSWTLNPIESALPKAMAANSSAIVHLTDTHNQLAMLDHSLSNQNTSAATAFKTLNNLNDINTSIGDIIRLLKSSSSSGSGSTHSNKLDALKHEIDKTMNEISSFKNEVSTRMKHNNVNSTNGCGGANNNLYQLDSASFSATVANDCCSSTSHYNHLSKYEKDILSILSKQKIKFHQKNNLDAVESRLITMDTAVNTDISMSNAVFTIRYDDDDEEQELQHESETNLNNPKQISVSSQTPRSSPIIVEQDDDDDEDDEDDYLITNNSFINLDLMSQLGRQRNSSSLFKIIKIEEQKIEDQDIKLKMKVKKKRKDKNKKFSILDDDEETALMNDEDDDDEDDDQDIIIMMAHDTEDIEKEFCINKEKRSMRRALTPLPIVESPTETYTYASNKSNYYYNESNNSKSNNHFNKGDFQKVPAISLLQRDNCYRKSASTTGLANSIIIKAKNKNLSPAPNYESNQSIVNIDSIATNTTTTSTTTTTPNTTTSSTTQQQHDENLKRLKIRIKNRQLNKMQNSNTSVYNNSNNSDQRHHFRRFKSTSASAQRISDDDDLYEEYNNRVNKNNHQNPDELDDDELDDDDDDDDDEEFDDSNNNLVNDITTTTTTTTNTSNSSSKRNPNSNVFKKIFTRSHHLHRPSTDYYQDADDFYHHNSMAATNGIRIEPISLVNIKAPTNAASAAATAANLNKRHISSSTSSSTENNINNTKQVKIPIRIINNSINIKQHQQQQPLIKSPIINFANQQKPTVDYSTFDSFADTTANISASSRSRCTIINSNSRKHTKPNNNSCFNEQQPSPQFKLKIIPLKRSNTFDLISSYDNTNCGLNVTNKRPNTNQFYPQHHQQQQHHCNTCSCCSCPNQQQRKQSPLVMNIRDGRFSSANNKCFSENKYKHHQHSPPLFPQHYHQHHQQQKLTKSSTLNQLPVNQYNHTTYHYKTNLPTTKTLHCTNFKNKQPERKFQAETTSKHSQKRTEYCKRTNSNSCSNRNQQQQPINQHINELSLLENLDEELDREIAKTIKSKSNRDKDSTYGMKTSMNNSRLGIDLGPDYSKIDNVGEEDLLAKEIGLTLNSLRRPHSAFQIDSYPVLNDDLIGMDDDEDNNDDDDDDDGLDLDQDDQRAIIDVVVQNEQEKEESSSNSNTSHYKINYYNKNINPSKFKEGYYSHHYQHQYNHHSQQNKKKSDQDLQDIFYESQNFNYQQPVNKKKNTNQQHFINKFPIHINNQTKNHPDLANFRDYEQQNTYYSLNSNAFKSNERFQANKNFNSTKQQSQKQQQQPSRSSSSKKETQKYFIHYPIGSSSNLTNTNTSSTNNETMSYFDFSVRDLAKSPFQLHESYNENIKVNSKQIHTNPMDQIMLGSNENSELNNFESTVMLNAYKLPKKKLNHLF